MSTLSFAVQYILWSSVQTLVHCKVPSMFINDDNVLLSDYQYFECKMPKGQITYQSIKKTDELLMITCENITL